MATAQVAVLPTCDVCGSKDGVDWYCVDCQEILCNRCKVSHQGMRKTKNDKIVPLSQAKVDTSRKLVPVLCAVHPTKICELFCEDCAELICIQCLSSKHKKHNFYEIEKLINSKESELEKYGEELRDKISNFNSLISEESQQHSNFVAHVDKLMTEVRNETDKIIQEFTQTRERHLLDLTQVKKQEEAMYKKKCNHFNGQISDLQKVVQDVEKAKKSGHVNVMVETVEDVRKAVEPTESPVTSKLKYPVFQRIYFQPSSVLRLNIPSIKEASLQIKPKRPAQLTIDMNNVKVTATIQVKGKSEYIRAICPTENNQAWIVLKPDHHLILVDMNGRTVRTSADVGGAVYNAVSYDEDILCTTWGGHCVMQVSKSGDSVTTFANLSPFYTRGLCVTSDKDILVCVVKTFNCPDSNCKIVRLNNKGEVTHEIQHNNQEPMFSCPDRVTSPGSGDIIVVDMVSYDVRRLICTDRSGKHRYTWTGQVGDTGKYLQKFTLSRVTHSNNTVYVTDLDNHCVYVLDSNGKAEQFMLDKKHEIKNPVVLTIDSRGRLWFGCSGAKVIVLE